MLTSLSNIAEERENGTKTRLLSCKLRRQLFQTNPVRTPAESYSRFSEEQQWCNFSHPFCIMQSSSLPLVMVKVVGQKLKSIGIPPMKCNSFTCTPKTTSHVMLVSGQYLHTRLGLEHISNFLSSAPSLVFVFRFVTSSFSDVLGTPQNNHVL